MEHSTENVEKKTVSKRLLRVANIMQYEEFLSEEKIKSVLSSYRTIEKYAYIKHDKDIDPKTGELKKPHWHIVIQFRSQQVLSLVAKWFGITENYIEMPKGRNAFIECVKYLTHESTKEQNNGKHHYVDDEVISNFDFRESIFEYEQKIIMTGKNKIAYLRRKVLVEGLKLSEIDIDDYTSDMRMLENCRREYLKKYAVLPPFRMNYYMRGGSGAGKTFAAKAFARATFDPDNQKRDEELFFIVGQQGAMFQGYDGQPVIIFDDIRSKFLMDNYNNNPGAIYNLLDPVPSSSEQNIKYGSVKLINSVFIITSQEPFDIFCKNICGNSSGQILISNGESEKQIYRRFPIIAEINMTGGYNLFVNKQFFDPDEPNYKAFIAYNNLGTALLTAAQEYGATSPQFLEMRAKHFQKPIEIYNQIETKFRPKEVEITEEMILNQQAEIERLNRSNSVEPVEVDISEYNNDTRAYSRQMSELLLMQKQIEEKINALKFKIFNPDLENQTGQNGQNFSQDASQIFNKNEPPF